MFSRNVPGLTEKLKNTVVGIAGCGGLGSNAAISLVRAGVGTLIIADFDKVELSNLNRQHFFQDDIGKYKTDALSKHLLNINRDLKVIKHNLKIKSGNISLFNNVDYLIEAFDKNSEKQMLIEEWCAISEKPIICGNGLSGCSGIADLKTKQYENIYFCGDFKTDISLGLCAPKVAIVANMQAAVVINLVNNNF